MASSIRHLGPPVEEDLETGGDAPPPLDGRGSTLAPPPLLQGTPSTVVATLAAHQRDLVRHCARRNKAKLRNRAAPARDRWRALATSLYLLLEFPSSSKAAKWTWRAMIANILVNALCCILWTLPAFRDHPTDCVHPVCTPEDGTGLCTERICPTTENAITLDIHAFTILVFAVDYFVRLATVHAVPGVVLYSQDLPIDFAGEFLDLSPKYKRDGAAKTWHFFTSFIAVVDLLSIVPSFLAFFFIAPYFNLATEDDGKLQNVLQVFRSIRLLKLARFNKGFLVFKRAAQASGPALRFFLFFVVVLVFAFGQLIYACEHGERVITPEDPRGVWMRPSHLPGGPWEPTPFTNAVVGMYWVREFRGGGIFVSFIVPGLFITTCLFCLCISFLTPPTSLSHHHTDDHQLHRSEGRGVHPHSHHGRGQGHWVRARLRGHPGDCPAHYDFWQGICSPVRPGKDDDVSLRRAFVCVFFSLTHPVRHTTALRRRRQLPLHAPPP